MALLEKLQDIKIIKDEIKNSIENKGVDTTNSAFADYPELIESIQSGGEDWTIDNIDYLFHSTTSTSSTTPVPNNRNNRNHFDNLIAHIKSPTSLYFTFNVSNNDDWWLTNEQFDKVLALDLSNVKNMYQAFYTNGAYVEGYKLIEIPNCINLYRAFGMWFVRLGDDRVRDVELDFNGTTGKVTNFDYAFRGTNSTTTFSCNIVSVLNINMRLATNINQTFYYAMRLTRLTFNGSFGGNSSTSSLTLDLSQTGLEHDAIVETFTTIGENTNGKTRIIKIKSTVYDQLTEEELAIATNKGYTITSA